MWCTHNFHFLTLFWSIYLPIDNYDMLPFAGAAHLQRQERTCVSKHYLGNTIFDLSAAFNLVSLRS